MVTRARPGKCEPRGPTSPLRASAAPPAPSPASGARFLLAASPRLRRPPPRLGPGQLAARGAPRRRSAPEWPPACRLPGHWGPRRNGGCVGETQEMDAPGPGPHAGPGEEEAGPGAGQPSAPRAPAPLSGSPTPRGPSCTSARPRLLAGPPGSRLRSPVLLLAATSARPRAALARASASMSQGGGGIASAQGSRQMPPHG